MFDQTSSSITNNRWKFLSNSPEGFLSVDGVSIDSMAQKYGTPFYVFVESEIRDRIRTFKKAFDYPNVRIQYACKCNSNLEIMRMANEEGIDIDASSVGEIMLALMADFQPTQVTFTNLYKTEQDMVFATKIGVQAITIDSIEELERADRSASQIGGKMRIFLRFNPLIDYQDYTTRNQQYGIPMTSAKDAIKKAIDSQSLELVGFHFHGAYIKYKEIYFEAAKKLVELAVYTRDNFGVEIKAIDLGGGMPYAGQPGASFDIETFGKEFSPFFKKLIEESGLNYPQLIFEPGKSIVMNAGMAVMKIISVKELPEKKVAVLDGSCYSNLPDILVSNESYHIKPTTIYNPQDLEKVTLAGCTCDCLDVIGSDVMLPKPKAGDLIVALGCGAYSTVMASNFNTLRRAPIVMIKENGGQKIIRRRDRYSELFNPELDVLKITDPNEMMNLYNMLRSGVKQVNGKSSN